MNEDIAMPGIDLLLTRDHLMVSNILLALTCEAVRVGPDPMQAPLAARESRAAQDADKHRRLVAAKASELLGALIQPEHQIITATFPRIEQESSPPGKNIDPVLQHYRSRYGCDEFAAYFLPSATYPEINP